MPGSSERVRALAAQKYVLPALRGGKRQFTVAVRDVLRDLVAEGFPAGNIPQVCSALRKREFLRENGIEIEGIDGPPSKMSTTVVYRYRAAGSGSERAADIAESTGEGKDPAVETSEARARRLGGKLRGLLKEELAQYGGGEAFLRWVRGYDEEDVR
ncbi:MAG: hypothetical protein WCC26_16100 [Terracidiphilus sp.]